MELFLLCDAPTDDDMDDCRYGGAWDGTLLDDNEVMVRSVRYVGFNPIHSMLFYFISIVMH